ncbi:MAG: glycosyltransferase family 61 protein [Janthinobacterium lividum]
MNILRPADWEYCGATTLDVLVDGIEADGCSAVLFSAEDYFAGHHGPELVLCRAPLLPFGGGLATATLRGLPAGQICVLAIVQEGVAALIVVCGVNIGRSPHTRWLVPRADAAAEAATRIRHPLTLTGSPLSHRAYERAADVRACDVRACADVGALLAAPPGPSGQVLTAPLLPAETLDPRAALVAGPGLGAAPYVSSPSYLARFGPCLVELPHGLVQYGSHAIWGDSSHSAFVNDPGMTNVPRMFRTGAGLGLHIDAVRRCAPAPGLPLIISNLFHTNHAHWLINSLLPAYLLRDRIAAGEIAVLVPGRTAYLEATLGSLGIPRDRMIIADPGLYQMDAALYASSQSTHNNDHPPRALVPMFAAIRAACLGGPARPGPERLYVTRMGSGAMRHIANEPALIAALARRGFTCVAPHELTFEDEVACFARARIVVGQLGAALVNIGFAPPGCAVVEIASGNYTSNDYLLLSSLFGHRFSRVLAPVDTETVHTHRTDFSFTVPIEQVLDAVDAALAAAVAASLGDEFPPSASIS